MTSANDRQVGGSHYRADIQHWDLIEDNGIGYLEGCATKYLTRWREKDGRQDLVKTQHYIEKLIEKATEIGRLPRGAVPPADVAAYLEANKVMPLEGAAIAILVSEWGLAELVIALDIVADVLTEHDRVKSTNN